jgi:hypothetical protein
MRCLLASTILVLSTILPSASFAQKCRRADRGRGRHRESQGQPIDVL